MISSTIRAFLLISMMLHLVLWMLPCVGAITHASWNGWILDARGVEAQATVTQVRKTDDEDGDKGVHAIGLAFPDRRGVQRSATVRTAREELLASATRHETIGIVYDPEEPSRARLRAEPTETLLSCFGAPLFLGSLWLIPLVVGVALALRSVGLYRHGWPAQGRVVRCEKTTKKNRDYKVEYVFYDRCGQIVKGAWVTFDCQAAGSIVWVQFDPASPRRNMLA